jgi:soluble lytic murein transglycosylase-like protein
MIVALLLMTLEARLLYSNAIVFLGPKIDEPLNDARQPSKAPSVSHADSTVNEIDALLKKFEINRANRKRVAEAIVQSSRKHHIDPRLVASVMIVESRGDPFAISSRNAVGIMQIHIPTWGSTADQEGINLFKIEDNVDFGVRILRDYVRKYGRDEGIERYNGWAPDAPETPTAKAYLQKVQNVYISRCPQS